jgi:hypothetical protein
MYDRFAPLVLKNRWKFDGKFVKGRNVANLYPVL